MPTLAIVNFNIVCATLGGFITLFGLVSYLIKEKCYLGEALISTLAGLIFSPHATNFVKPLEYANGNEENLETITLYFSRLVLGVQLVLAGVQLPSKYLKTEWKSLSLLLGPGMCAMWICTSLLVWAMVPNIPILYALAVGSCVTPTDPVLSNSIVKGKFADKNIPPSLQRIIIAESGANDGLGYPFLFLAIYLIKYTDAAASGLESGGAGEAMRLWFGDTWAYTILLSVVYGAMVGWLAKELLHWAEERHYVDRESFLVFAITMALFTTGTVGLIGSDDVLACFIAGNVFTWDDWFRLETMDDSLQPTIDMLLNVAIFMWFGAVCPWHKFVTNSVIPIYRLVPLGILVLLFRRIPMVLCFHWLGAIKEIEDIRHALFVGFFGPIGVSAIFYLYISRAFLRDIDGREDIKNVREAIEIVVWFLVMCSIFVHGLSIPMGKLGLYLPRTLSTAISSERVSASQTRARSQSPSGALEDGRESISRHRFHRRSGSEDGTPMSDHARSWSSVGKGLVLFGKHIKKDITRPGGAHAFQSSSRRASQELDVHPNISGPMNARPMGRAIPESSSPVDKEDSQADTNKGEIAQNGNQEELNASSSDLESGFNTPANFKQPRAIQFADERIDHSSLVPGSLQRKTS